jgi:hypothetical protein
MRIRFCALVLVGMAAMAADTSTSSPAVTFNKDVLPILQRSCQTCHRPGQIAPMSFLSYQSTRPWAKAMKAAVAARKMPPWFADSQVGHFLNDRSLKQSEIDTIAKWADGGAPEGDAKDAPAPLQWPEGWQIQPDVIVAGPVTDVPAHPKNNVIEWAWVTVPSGFTKDMWVTSIQIKPEHPEVTHHMCVAFKPHTADVKYNDPFWVDRERDEEGAALPDKGETFGGRRNTALVGTNGLEDCYLPGMISADYRIHNAAKLIPAGSDIMINLHYTPNGVAVTDHVQIGFTVAGQPPERRYVSINTSSTTDPKVFAIPPNDGNWQSPPMDATFLEDVELVFMMPHMHVRGKDMTYKLIYPDGREQVVLHVPHYDFNWQLGYDTSIKVPKGTKLHVDAHFDNSPNNKFNPNPNRTVYYGEMTWEEMMAPFLGVVVGKDADPRKLMSNTGRPNGA